ncbi:MAG TPA: hypothetical protein VNQ77_05990 [Frankiaceae bacterium]|nr:hypothetical protein [Frankiaceae bacterium]
MDPYEIVEQGGVPELTEWVRGLVVGSITVLDVEYDAGPDPQDQPALFVDLTITDPVPGPGWPAEDIIELTHRVWARCGELRLPNWYVRPHSLRSRLQKAAAEGGG